MHSSLIRGRSMQSLSNARGELCNSWNHDYMNSHGFYTVKREEDRKASKNRKCLEKYLSKKDSSCLHTSCITVKLRCFHFFSDCGEEKLELDSCCQLAIGSQCDWKWSQKPENRKLLKICLDNKLLLPILQFLIIL